MPPLIGEKPPLGLDAPGDQDPAKGEPSGPGEKLPPPGPGDMPGDIAPKCMGEPSPKGVWLPKPPPGVCGGGGGLE